MSTRAQRQLSRVAQATGITSSELRDLIESVVDEYLGDAPRQRRTTGPLVTGAREVFGEGHATVSYISDPEGTDIVPPGYEPPPGYHGTYRVVS